MNEQLHTNCSILRDKAPVVLPIKLSIKDRGPDFFKQIVQRYDIIRKSNRFLSLILLRFMKNASGTTKLTNISRNNIKRILNTGIRQHNNLYLTIRSGQNATVSGSYFNDTLSPGRYVPEQVNMQTDHVKDTKHIVMPPLMSSLERIDDQDPGYEYQPVSEKTSAITELARTLPERIVYQRKKSENTEGNNPKSNIRVVVDTFQPVLARTLQEKTQSSGIQIEKTELFSGLQHLKMPDPPLFNGHTNPVTTDIPEVEVSENTKARDVMMHPFIHIKENIPKIDAIITHIQKRNKLVYEKHNAFHKRTADRYLLIKKNNIAGKLILNTYIARTGKPNVENDGISEIPEVLSHRDNILFQHAINAKTGMSGPLNVSSNNIVRNPFDLVFRNPSVHRAEEGLENTGKPDFIKTQRIEINAEKKDIRLVAN